MLFSINLLISFIFHILLSQWSVKLGFPLCPNKLFLGLLSLHFNVVMNEWACLVQFICRTISSVPAISDYTLYHITIIHSPSFYHWIGELKWISDPWSARDHYHKCLDCVESSINISWPRSLTCINWDNHTFSIRSVGYNIRALSECAHLIKKQFLTLFLVAFVLYKILNHILNKTPWTCKGCPISLTTWLQ